MKKLGLLVIIYTLLFLACFSVSGSTHTLRPIQVAPQEESSWLRWVIPLPKRISIKEKVEIVNSDIKIQVSDKTGDVGKNAAAKLVELLKIDQNNNETKFEIFIGVCDTRGKVGDLILPEAAKLSELPNKNQAYCITPVNGNRLVITALDEKGLYYGVLTLRSLMEATLAENRVAIPLAKVTDWPDIPERGQWAQEGYHAPIKNDIEWMASLKMNLVELISPYEFVRDTKHVALIDTSNIELARLNAVKYVPIMNHLDKISGLYEAYPELKGKGKSARKKTGKTISPCTSQPKLPALLAELMMSLAGNPGVDEVCCWLAEIAGARCGCEECKNINQSMGELRVILDAWRIARRKYHNLGLRLLLTQCTYPINDKILAAVPEEVGVTYYHGGLTYNSSKDPMIYPLLAEYAAKGRWLGCYPTANANWFAMCPWSGPQFIKYRANEFVDKKLKCVAWHVTPSRYFYDFNLAAAAEWSWNAGGRSEHEFSAAWATRKGFKDPDAMADWAVMLGPVSWNLHGSNVPFQLVRAKKIQKMLESRKMPVLGRDMFRYWATIEDFDRDLAIIEKALKIAKRQDSQPLIDETMVVQGYIKMTREIYLLTKQLAAQGPMTDPKKVKMRNSMEILARACLQTTTALRSWVEPIGFRAPIGEGRIKMTLQGTDEATIALADAVAAHGIENNTKGYLSGKAATWTARILRSQ